MVNRRQLLEFIKENEEYNYLYICDKKSSEYCKFNLCDCTDYFLTFIKNPNLANRNGWQKVKNNPKWTLNEILSKTTLIDILNNLEEKVSPIDSSSRWTVTDERNFFNIYSDLMNFNKTRFDYLKLCLDNSLRENVQLIEFRRTQFKGLYYFDEQGNRVQMSLDDELNRLLQFKDDYIRQNPSFIDFNYIINGLRNKPKEEIQIDLEMAYNQHKRYPSFVKGYDLVGEEDKGHSLLFHADAFLNAFRSSPNDDHSNFYFYFHNGETNLASDMMPPQLGDDTSVTNNVYDALAFRTHRIGHGLAYIKHPHLYEILREQNIAIEICPASNQLLGIIVLNKGVFNLKIVV